MSARNDETLSAEFFDAKYLRDEDPWQFATSVYERDKYTQTLGALTRQRYGSVLEIGCSIGIFTQRLAERCDDLLAVDLSERALERARRRCEQLAQVRFATSTLPERFPDGRFDLVVVSEVGYYWPEPAFARVLDGMCTYTGACAEVVLVHYTPYAEDHARSGDSVHEQILADRRFARVSGRRETSYRIDVLRKVIP